MTDKDTLRLFERAGSATVYEANGRIGDIDPAIGAITPGLAVAGPAFTLACDVGDNLALHRAVAQASAGDVLVVGGHGAAFGYLGDILAEAAQSRGIAGVIVDGYVRDVAELRRMGFPVWARGLAIRGATKTRPGAIGVTLSFGGVDIVPGDIIVGDDDGACVVAAGRVSSAAQGTLSRLALEVGLRESLRNGEVTLDLLDLRKYLGGAI